MGYESRKVISNHSVVKIDGESWRQLALEPLRLHIVEFVIFKNLGSADDGKIASDPPIPQDDGNEVLGLKVIQQVNSHSVKLEDVEPRLMLKEIAWMDHATDFGDFEINEGGSGKTTWDLNKDIVEVDQKYSMESEQTLIVTF